MTHISSPVWKRHVVHNDIEMCRLSLLGWDSWVALPFLNLDFGNHTLHSRWTAQKPKTRRHCTWEGVSDLRRLPYDKGDTGTRRNKRASVSQLIIWLANKYVSSCAPNKLYPEPYGPRSRAGYAKITWCIPVVSQLGPKSQTRSPH